MANYSAKLGLSALQSVLFGGSVVILSIGVVYLSGSVAGEEVINAQLGDIQYFSSIIKVALATIVIGWIYVWLSKPLLIRFEPDAVDRIPNGKLLARAARSRKSGKIPPAFPTGWYKIVDSSQLAVGEVKYIEFFNEHLALYRGENGKAAILDAYCPHLGANIAVEGRVVGNCIECPFHGWQFREDGKCTTIPYLDKVPEVAKTRAWPVLEENQMIYVWYDMLGRLEDQPWTPPTIKEVESGNYVFHGSFENYVEAHIQEIPENGSDVAHLGVLHVPFVLKWLPFITHKWSANWTTGEAPEEHIARIKLTQCLLFFGKEIPFTHVTAHIRQIGPGLVFLDLNTSMAHIVVVETVTPMKPLFQKVSHVVFGKKGFFHRLHAKIVLGTFSHQFNRDVVIWNNKTYITKPIIVKNDGNILGFRRWYSRFYPDAELLQKYQETNKDLAW